MHRSSCSALSSQSRPRHLPWQWAEVLLVALLILCSCGAPPQNLSFTPLTSDNPFTPLGGYDEEAPALVVIANPQDLINPDLGIHFASGLGDPLRALDYRSTFAVLVFQGRQGSSGYGVMVQQVTRTGSLVSIHATFISPLPDHVVRPIFTSPYQLAVIEKDSAWEVVNRFELVVDGTVVATAAHSIP
jgi:hypothetical protein